MSDESVPADVQSLWQGQPSTGGPMSIDELRHRSRQFTRIISRRNLLEYIAGAVLVVLFGWMTWVHPITMMRVASAVSLAGVIFVVYYLRRHGAARTMPAEMALTSCLAFHRGELERQRDLVRGVWRWYLGPLMPGLLLFYLGGILARPEHAVRAVLLLAGSLAMFVLIGQANQLAAKRLQARIDALERDS